MACEPYTSSGREEEEGKRQVGCVRTACLLHCCRTPLPVAATAGVILTLIVAEQRGLIPHLPLMGIVNGRPSVSVFISKTHYPSWGYRKHGSISGLAINNSGSLPLMGIVNVLLWCSLIPEALISLPLMGIVNTPTQVGDGTQVSSLPLMGIVNARALSAIADSIAKLITPHGDRKPEAPHREHVQPIILITPHGDRKPQGDRKGPCLRCPLITPHGDRKLGPAGKINRVHHSLPLMGIVNNQPPGAPGAPGALITPHGDRKRATADHYDGWLAFSLPLMGIVNRRGRGARPSPTRPHYPSWGS